MACLQLTVSVPVKIATITILMSVIFKAGSGLGLTGICRPFCTRSDCITVNQDRVDFTTAQEACHGRNGELLTFQSDTGENILDIFAQELYGNFWIGLRLPAGACSNLSAPLRGYEWTSGSVHSSFVPSFSTWQDSVKVCSPRCVSLSSTHKWTERLCSDKADGFLCKTKHKDACKAEEVSDPNVFHSSEDCASGPCQQICTDVKGGYKCSCTRGYIPDSRDLRRCKIYCAQHKCPAICDRHTDSSCFCPDGFVIDDKFCVDIDECAMDQCAQECNNTFGSFKCSCRKGFALKDEVQCIKVEDSDTLVITTPVAIGSVKPAVNNDTLKGSSASAGGFICLWIFIAAAVVVLVFVMRFYVHKRQKRSEQNSCQQAVNPVNNAEC